MEYLQYLWLGLLGLGVGTFGTLIGAGGGFILMPILLLVYPDRQPVALTAISLAVVFFNASSGSYSYARMKRIDFKSGLLFLLTGIPGASAGAYIVNYIPRKEFNFAFGGLLLASGLFILLRTFGSGRHRHETQPSFMRTVVDAEGNRYTYGFSLATGMTISFAVGLASSILGIGGGIIHVPAMANLLNFPVHVATATSHFILAVMALIGSVVHIFDGSLGLGDLPYLAPLAVGATIGARAGAALSTRIHGRWIMRSLAIALGLVGVRILMPALTAMLAGR
jgi:hypothetical protein